MTAMLIFTRDAAWRGMQLARHKNTQVRYFLGTQKIPVGLYSCGKYAYVIFWGGAPFAIQIEDRKVADAFVEYFELMWKTSSKEPPPEATGEEP
jgi:hypothetical protein